MQDFTGWEGKIPAEPAKATGLQTRQGSGWAELPVTPALDTEFLGTWGTAGQAGVKAHFIAEEK